MARYVGPKCKLCRREGTKLFLKGTRCTSEKCAITRRNQIPGQHGTRYRRSRVSDFGKHLREKQKVKRIYGLLESQFRRYYEKASKTRGVTGQTLLAMLETRLDNVVYVSGMARSRNEARQVIRQNKVTVNGSVVNIPSYQLTVGDVVCVDGKTAIQKPEEDMPDWISWDTKKAGCKVERLPKREDISHEIQEQLIVEYYSR